MIVLDYRMYVKSLIEDGYEKFAFTQGIRMIRRSQQSGTHEAIRLFINDYMEMFREVYPRYMGMKYSASAGFLIDDDKYYLQILLFNKSGDEMFQFRERPNR